MDKSTLQIDQMILGLDNFIDEILAFDKSKTDLESKLSVFDFEKLTLAENTLLSHQSEKSDLEVKTKRFENEISDMVELLPKHVKSIQFILNEISAVQYSIKPE